MGDELVKIVVQPGGSSFGTKLFAANGAEIKGVTSVDIKLRPDDIVVATIGLILEGGVEVEAHPLLTEETLRRSADALGYSLLKAGADPERPKQPVKGRYHIDEDGTAWIDVRKIGNTASRWEGPYVLVSPCVEESDHPLSGTQSDRP